MANKNGQVSMEYIMLLGALLLILGLLMVIFLGQYSQQSLLSQNRLADHTLSVLADEAQQVWVGGPGAEHKLLVDFPPTADLSRSSITGRVIQLYMSGQGDVSHMLPFYVSGSWPAYTGQAYMSVYNNGSMVFIRPAGRLLVNITGIYMNLVHDNTLNSTTFLISNQANVTYALTQTVTWPPCLDGRIYTPSSPGNLNAGTSQTEHLTVQSAIIGMCSGYISIVGVPAANSGLPDENITIPVTVRVN